jgi:hypothetical protein
MFQAYEEMIFEHFKIKFDFRMRRTLSGYCTKGTKNYD